MNTENTSLKVRIPPNYTPTALGPQYLYSFPSACVKCSSSQFGWIEYRLTRSAMRFNTGNPEVNVQFSYIKIPACDRCARDYEKYLEYLSKKSDLVESDKSKLKKKKFLGGIVLGVITLVLTWLLSKRIGLDDPDIILVFIVIPVLIALGIGSWLGGKLPTSSKTGINEIDDVGSHIGFRAYIIGDMVMEFENHDFARKFLEINSHAKEKSS